LWQSSARIILKGANVQHALVGSEQLSHDIPREMRIYTDGGCSPNPGPGGWSAIIRWDRSEWTLSGNDPDTTNNRMELHAAVAALGLLDALLGPCQVAIYTDSQYLRQGITSWIDDWVSRGWRTAGGQPVKNQDLWQVVYRLAGTHQVTWHWLPGHAGHPHNERADRLATAARQALVAGTRAEPPSAGAVEGGAPGVTICVKASSDGPSGKSGWAAIMRRGSHTRALSGSDPDATSNAMLLGGAAEALRALRVPSRVTVCSDAQYLILGASAWVEAWQARGWHTREGKPVANREEWEALLEAARPHQVTWLLTRGEAAPADLRSAARLAAEAASRAAL
jgi:ribonuclease HI